MGRVARLRAYAALLTGVALGADAVLSLVADTDDHTRGAGLASELLFALAATLVALFAAAVHGLRAGRRSWSLVERIGLWVAVAGLLAVAVVAISVPVRGEEPSDAVAVPVVLAALLGLVAFGIAIAVLRVVPWWVGIFLAVFFPVLFLAGAAGALAVAAGWLLVAFSLRPTPTL